MICSKHLALGVGAGLAEGAPLSTAFEGIEREAALVKFLEKATGEK